MLSLKDVAATTVAIEIVCNNSQLKKEILCLPGSDYDANKPSECRYRKRQWDDILENKTRIVLENLGLTKQLQEKVIGIVLSVGIRILSWAKYHEKAIGFSRNYSFNFLNSSFFTMRGIVDCKKAATELMNDKSLGKKEKYKVALYCMNERIPALHKKLTKKEKKECMIRQPDFIKFWEYYHKNQIYKLRGDTNPKLYWLQMAVKSGNKDSVEYCLKKTNLIKDESALVYAAFEAVQNYFILEYYEVSVFESVRSDTNWEAPWVPFHYYTDIICFLFLKMKLNTRIEFLKEAINFLSDEVYPEFGENKRSRVLECFLDWPYQDYFLRAIRLTWDFLPDKSYFYLIKRFALRDDLSEYMHQEELSYDYTVLLWEFLSEIPESKKRYVFREYRFDFYSDMKNAGTMLLSRLITQKKYTFQVKIIIEWLLSNATDEEKGNIISSTEGISMCLDLMELGRWELLDECVSNCYTTNDKVQKFKKKLCFEEAYLTCLDFMAVDKWHEVESFIKWSALSYVEINQLKEEMILTEYGTCLKIFSHDNKLTAVDKVIRWCFPNEEKVSAIKKKLCYSSEGMWKCADFVTEDKVEIANELINWSFSSEEEIRQYKIDLANEIGREACVKLICNIYHKTNRTRSLKIVNWEEVEIFITWCFSSEDEIHDFKKSVAMKDADGTRDVLTRLHTDLMRYHKWADAKALFVWLNLSVKEIRELKRETILSEYCMAWMDISLRENSPVKNSGQNVEGIWEKVELVFRWCLEDEDAVFEFKNKFDEFFGIKSYEDRGDIIPYGIRNHLNQFYLFIGEFLKNLLTIKKSNEL